VKGLPPILRRAPTIFYGLAVLFFVASFVLSVIDVNMTMSGADTYDPVVRQAKLRGLYQAALEAGYMVANGVIAQILIAIWDRGIRRDEGVDE
jgi:hypothetical protein